MSYYMGDYYQGGFFGSLFRGIGGLAKGVLGIGGGTKTIIQQVPAQTAANPVMSTAIARLGTRAGAFVKGHPVLSAAAAAGVGALALGGAAGAAARGRGVHPAVAAAMGIRKKHKRINPYNPRALRRAVRRAHLFSKMARKVLRFTSPKPPKGRPFFKHRKRKA